MIMVDDEAVENDRLCCGILIYRKHRCISCNTYWEEQYELTKIRVIREEEV